MKKNWKIYEDKYVKIDNFNIRSVTIIGHSLGGMIALLYAIKYPDKIKKLVLIAPACSKKYSLFLRLLTIPIIGEIFLKPPASCKEVSNSFKKLTYDKFEMPIEIVKRAYEIYTSSGYIKSAFGYFRNYLNIFGLSKKGIELYKYVENSIKNIDKSVLLFWGKKDKIILMKQGELLIKKLKNLKYYKLEDCGHNPHWELADEFNKTVTDFIKYEDF
jgi:proline iminopeptidase